MRDPVSIERVKQLHPAIASEVAEIITEAEKGFPETVRIRIAQGYRTYAEQDALYAIGRTKPGKKVTNAKGGYSLHNFRLAVDFVLLYDKNGDGVFEEVSWNTVKDFDKDGIADWQEVVKAFEARGYEWGGRWRTFKDYPHVQKTFGKTLAWLRAHHKEGQIIDLSLP